MATTNSVFLTVRATPPAPQTGWVVKVRHHRDFTTLVAVVNEVTALTITTELNSAGAGTPNVGAGSITLDVDSPFWTTTLTTGEKATVLRDREYLWEAWYEGVCRAQWLGRTVEEHLVTEDQTRAVTISGPGPADVLRWAKVMPPGFPNPASADPGGLNWPWRADLVRPAMSIWLWLLQQAQKRGAVPWVSPTFTATNDSGGVKWVDVAHPYNRLEFYKPELGADLLSLLNTLTGQDYDQPAGMRAEWVMHPGFKLDVRPVIGVHRESNVIFFESDTVLDNDRTRTREDLANVVIVRDSAGVMSIATDSASVNTWNRREEYVDEANLVDKPRRDQVAQIMLAQRKAEKSQWTISVDPNSPSRRVFRDFDLGDWVGIHRFNPDLTATIDAYRVMAITVQVDQNGKETLELTLETKLDALVRKLQRQLTAIKFTNNNVKVTLPDGGAAPQPLVWDPGTKSWVPGSWPSTPPGGVQVFIQSTDPGSAAHTGDFWYQT